MATAPVRRRRQRAAEDRLRRLLVMLPWLMERGSVPVREVAERFALTDDEVAADLELVSMCGLPPYVDELIDVFIDEGTVHVGVPRLFTRALRLNSVEAFDLVVAGRAAMELPGADPDGPLGRGLAKLEAVLATGGPSRASAATDRGAGGDRRVDDDAGAVTIDLERPEVADELAAAVSRHEWLQITYWSASTDTTADRRIVPRQVFADRGNWYVVADDDRTGSRRTFRLDRIASVRSTGDHAEPLAEPLPPPGEWFADADVERVTLHLAEPARWVVERYPVDDVVADDTGLTVVLPVVSRRWLERLLVRLGPHAAVEAPAELRELGRDAARRVLAAYARA